MAVYKIPVTINGVVRLFFVVDSGASDVSIPLDVFSVLKRAETISDDDVIGMGLYRLADGTTVENTQFVIRELKLGEVPLKNIEASVGKSSQGQLLLGQSFLKRFASVHIDNNRHVLVLGEPRTGESSISSPTLASRPETSGNKPLPDPAIGHEPTRGRIGITMQDLDANLVQSSGVLEGAAIARVEPLGPADWAGIKVGDIVSAVDGVTVRSGNELKDRILRSRAGTTVDLTIIRDNRILKIKVAVGRVATETR